MKKIFPKTLMRITRFSPSKPVVKASRKIAFETLESRQMLAGDAVAYGPPIPESSPGETAFVAESPQPMIGPTLETFIANASSSQSVVISEETVPIDAEIENESSGQAEIRRVVFSSQDFSDSLNDDFTLVTTRPSVTNLSDSENLAGENNENNSGGGGNSGGGTSGGSSDVSIYPTYDDLDFIEPPAESDSTEWGTSDFWDYYRNRANPTPYDHATHAGDSVALDDPGVNLLDDYRRAMRNGTNGENWETKITTFLQTLTNNLVAGNLSASYSDFNVSRNFTYSDDLFVYGNGYTKVTPHVSITIISQDENEKGAGVVCTTTEYSISIDFECEVNDSFREPFDISGLEVGTPFWLTGQWTEHATLNWTLATEN